jgi:flagellar basal body-associated protein FliL
LHAKFVVVVVVVVVAVAVAVAAVVVVVVVVAAKTSAVSRSTQPLPRFSARMGRAGRVCPYGSDH